MACENITILACIQDRFLKLHVTYNKTEAFQRYMLKLQLGLGTQVSFYNGSLSLKESHGVI